MSRTEEANDSSAVNSYAEAYSESSSALSASIFS